MSNANIKTYFPSGKYDELKLDLDMSLSRAKNEVIKYMKDNKEYNYSKDNIIRFCLKHPATARAAGINLDDYMNEEN